MTRYFAKINKDNVVDEVIVANSQEWCEKALGGEWLQTSYNTQGGVHREGGSPLRKNYATIGCTYDRENDAFILQQPFPSWTLDTETFTWRAPKTKPDNGFYYWDEVLGEWVKTELI